jgi:hypothetical protein
MRRVLLAFALCALVAASLVAAFEETERVTRTIALEAGGTLRLKTFSGQVTIRASDRPEVVIDALRRADRRQLDRIKLDIRTEGSTVVVDANHRDRWLEQLRNNVVATDLDITVPRRTNIDVNTFSAPVTVEGVEGSYRVHGFSSRIRLNDVTGPIEAHTFSGPIEIHASGWQDHQTIDVDTFSGSVRLRLPDNARGAVTFRSFSGHLNSEVPLTLHSTSRRSFSAELGSSSDGGRLRFKTFSGSVQIDR